MVNRLTQGKAVVGGLVAEDDITAGDDVVVGGDLTVTGSIVFGDQQASIADPTGGATIDAQSRTAIVAIINALEAVGILEPPA